MFSSEEKKNGSLAARKVCPSGPYSSEVETEKWINFLRTWKMDYYLRSK
jgi:hypothetical protein